MMRGQAPQYFFLEPPLVSAIFHAIIYTELSTIDVAMFLLQVNNTEVVYQVSGLIHKLSSSKT